MSDKLIKKNCLSHADLILMTVSVGILALLLRVNDADFILNSLWAEDGNIFIRQAIQYGFESIWMPYAGYLHVYPRLTAFLVTFIPTIIIPYLFFAGWFCSFLILIYVMTMRARLLNLNALAIVFLIFAVALQPHSGEVFFSLTNAQWLLGAAFILYVCTPDDSSPKIYELFLLLLISLTGPFSLFIIPILALQLVLLKDFQTRKWVYITIMAGALIQLLFIFLTGMHRISGSFDQNVWDQFASIINFFNFGSNSASIVIIVFWGILSLLVISHFLSRNTCKNKYERFIPLFLILAIALVFAAAIFTSKGVLSPLDDGARYYVIPYSLLFFLAVLLARNQKILQGAFFCLIGLIDAESFVKYERPNLQWEAFSKFSEIKPELIIPIQPQWAEYPGWHVNVSGKTLLNLPKTSSYMPIALDLNLFSSVNAKINKQEDALHIFPTTDDPQLYIDIGEICSQDKFIGIEINAWNKSAGLTEIFWGMNKQFSQTSSLKQSYPEGDVILQFAFKRNIGDTWLRIDPENETKFYKMLIYCLGDDN